MAMKGAQKRGTSQAAPPPKRNKATSPKGRLFNPTEGVPPNQVAPPAPTTKKVRKVKGHVPNDETIRVLRDIEAGKGLLRYESLEEMCKDLGM
jgi:hypothetical protein